MAGCDRIVRIVNTHPHEGVVAKQPWLLSLVALGVRAAHVHEPERPCDTGLAHGIEPSGGGVLANARDFLAVKAERFPTRDDSDGPAVTLF